MHHSHDFSCNPLVVENMRVMQRWYLYMQRGDLDRVSTLIISPLRRLASSKARRVSPEPVEPEMTMTFSFSLASVLCVAVTKRRRWREVRDKGSGGRRDLWEKEGDIRKLHNPPLIISCSNQLLRVELRVETKQEAQIAYCSYLSFGFNQTF